MPTWFIVALAGHLANGTAFIIDKTLLRGSFKHPATYAALIGSLGILAIVLLPFGVAAPDALGWTLMIASGATFTLSLWAFFASLSRGEASRVIPVIGSLIPIFTLLGTSLFLHEQLTTAQGIGFFLLIVATLVLASGKAGDRLTTQTVLIATLSAVLFAFSSVTAKAAYDSSGFLTTFTISRFAGVVAAGIILWIAKGAFKELSKAITGKGAKPKGPVKNPLLWVIIAQVLGGVGFLGVQGAIALGSAALVNALQAVQYALLVMVAFALHKRAPQLLGEDLRPAIVIQKSLAIVLVAAGLWLVV